MVYCRILPQKPKERTEYESDNDGKFRLHRIDGTDSRDSGTRACRFRREEGGSSRQAAHHPRGGAPAERELPHPPAYAQRTAHRLCRAARQVPLPAVGNRPSARRQHRHGRCRDTGTDETQPHAAHGRQTQRKEDVGHGTAYPQQFRELDAEGDGTARPSGRDAALHAAVRQSPEPDGRDQAFRQPRPVHAAPDQQAHPATLPQHRCAALQDTWKKDLLQRGGRADVPLRTCKGFPQGRHSLLQGSYP